MDGMTGLGPLVRKAVAVNLLPADLLTRDIPVARARDLFAAYVDEVELEAHGFCNRVCWFCPNAFLDRRRRLRRMPDAVFERIVADLESIGYAGMLTWARYHEPMAHAGFFAQIETARRRLPRASLVVISNGDYLDAARLARLEAVRVERLILDLYLPEGREHDEEAAAGRVAALARRLGRAVDPCGEAVYRIASPTTKVTLEVARYTPENVSTRAGLLDVPKRRTYRRRAVCVAPVRHVVVDHDGKGMLCCQTRSDAPAHRGAIVGDLARPGYGLFHLYRDLGPARRALLAPGPKGGVCETCDVRDDGPDRLARRPWLAAGVGRLPGAEALGAAAWQRLVRKRRDAGAGVGGTAPAPAAPADGALAAGTGEAD